MRGTILALFKHGGLFFMLILKDPNPISTVKVMRGCLIVISIFATAFAIVYGGLSLYDYAQTLGLL